MTSRFDDEARRIVNVRPYTGKLLKAWPEGAPAAVSSPYTADTYGSWVELIPANAITVDFLVVGYFLGHMTYIAYVVLDIGTGAAGAETPDIIYGAPLTRVLDTYGSDVMVPTWLPTPVRVTANSRVSARVLDNLAASRTYFVKVITREVD